ncbi:MAG: hypothetical protein KDD02_09760 [Phaeodactylibacter sp.]|nr:hypothetical protein [Phaeodactylibacter sp.]MCB9302605.1 hypothetical protein [Lewinellaceae bacterium]
MQPKPTATAKLRNGLFDHFNSFNMEFIRFTDLMSVKVAVIIAGLLGGLLAGSSAGKLTWKNLLIYLFCGAACAAYLTPMLSNRVQAGEATSNGLAFIVGIMSMSLVRMIRNLGLAIARKPEAFLSALTKSALFPNDKQKDSSE